MSSATEKVQSTVQSTSSVLSSKVSKVPIEASSCLQANLVCRSVKNVKKISVFLSYLLYIN